MKKTFFYLCVLFIWSVGGAYAAAANDAPLVLEKPPTMPSMAWLKQLETKRSELLQNIGEKFGELDAYTTEISATIGGKYGISSTPATPEEREEMVRSIHRTRQMFPFAQDLTAIYLGKDASSTDVLSENSLREIAERTQTDPKVFQSHLAAIAVVDGASFTFKLRDALLDPETVRGNILLAHHDAQKNDLNRLLNPILEPAKKPLVETLIQTLKKVTKTEDVPVSTFLKSAAYNCMIVNVDKRTKRNFIEVCRTLTETSGSDLADIKKRLQISERLKIGNPKPYLDLISKIESNSTPDIVRYNDEIAANPDADAYLLIAILYVNAGKKLGKDEKWIKAVCSMIIGHSYDLEHLEEAADILESCGEKGLALEALKRAIKHPQATADNLIWASYRLEDCGERGLALEALKRAIKHPQATVDNLISVFDRLEGLAQRGLALRAIKHPQATADNIIWAAGKVEGGLALEALEGIIKHPQATVDNLITVDSLISTFYKLEDRGEEDLALKALKRAINHRDVTPGDLISVFYGLESRVKNGLALEALKRVINHHDVMPNDLIWAADELKDQGEEGLVLEALKRAINHRDVTPSDLARAFGIFERCGEGRLALKALEGAINHRDVTLGDLISVFHRLEVRGEEGLALEALEKAINHPNAATLSSDNLIWAQQALGQLPDSEVKTQIQERIKQLLSKKTQ